ncbi:MAG: DUF4124 domain-containing protein [Halomonadaceae bacterium]|nr:MAG: DUF4124 domain-containing protein [Halomonadaceae bacterium]
MTHRPAALCLLIGCLFASHALGGSIYRWVDEEGNVQFSETPPSDRQSEQTRYRTGRSAGDSGSSGPALTSPQRSETPGTPAAEPEEETETVAREMTPEQQQELSRQHQANCEAARVALETIQNNARLRVEENGEMRFLTPEEIEQRREKLEGVQAESCNWSPPVSDS